MKPFDSIADCCRVISALEHMSFYAFTPPDPNTRHKVTLNFREMKMESLLTTEEAELLAGDLNEAIAPVIVGWQQRKEAEIRAAMDLEMDCREVPQ